MKKIISLTKVLFKNLLKQGRGQAPKNKKSMIFLYLFLIIYLFGIFSFTFYNMITSLKEFNQESLFLGLILFGVSSMIVVTSIFSCINIFYFSKDNEYILYLPLKPKEIFISKFLVLLTYEYFMEAVFVVPGLIIYGYLVNAQILFYLYSLGIFIVLPIVPLIFSTLIVAAIMCFSKLTKYKERFQLITGVLAITIAIGIQFVTTSFVNTQNETDMIELINKSNGLVTEISKYFITVEPSIQALVNSNEVYGFLGFLKLILITLVFVLILIFVGDKAYFKGLTGNMETANKKRRKSYKIETKSQDKLETYIKKEFKLLLRNPVFFMQCVLPSFLMPILFAVIFFLNAEGIGEIRNGFIEIAHKRTLISFIVLTIIQFIGTMNYTSITAISREGTSAPYNKSLPIPLYNQIMAKIIPGIIITAISTFICMVIIFQVLYMTVLQIALIVLASNLLNVIQSYIWIWIDFKKPKLNWDTEYAVAKQNFNMFYEIIIGLAFMILMVMLGINFSMVNYIYVIIPFITMLILLWVLIDKYFRKNQDKLYEKIV